MTVVDATKDLLVKVLKYHPFLVKPNHHELGRDLSGVPFKDRGRTSFRHAKETAGDGGAEMFLISMAGEGAVLVAANRAGL